MAASGAFARFWTSRGCMRNLNIAFMKYRVSKHGIATCWSLQFCSCLSSSNGKRLNDVSMLTPYLSIQGQGQLPVASSVPHSVASGWGFQSSRSKYSGHSSDVESDEESDDEYDDVVGEEFGPHFPEDSDLPNNYKEIKKHLKSMRVDAVLGGGLNLSRKKVDDYFLDSKILLNGEKLTKKSKQMDIGDCVDLIAEKTDESIRVKRVRLVNISGSKTSKDRNIVYLRVWKSNVTVDKPPSDKRW